jgi:tyrosyl-tRNA synthetase
MDLYGELTWRGMVYDTTEGLPEALAQGPVIAYAGFDPTAASLHVGSLLPIMALARLQRHGHGAIALIGGGTGLIGDPSGKSVERTLLDADRVEANSAGIRRQLEHFLDFHDAANPARLVDNAEWLTRVSALEFMRDVGKYFTVNYMLAKESVKRRVESADGISYTEFSYLLLQAYDFLVLHDRFNCTVQLGGSDQWGNITAGLDLIRKLRATRSYGLVLPLVTTSAGAKFGKTEAGTVWLDATLTTPYEFYQFWVNVDDRDAATYLKYFTFLDEAHIAELELATTQEPERRHAQKTLAREVTQLVHGASAVAAAEEAAQKLFRGNLSAMSVSELLQIFPNVPSREVLSRPEGWPVVDLLTTAGITASKGEATRLIRGGGLSVNDQRVADEKMLLRPEHAIEGRVFVIRKGKREYFLVSLVPVSLVPS